jgi:hypothetical protein
VEFLHLKKILTKTRNSQQSISKSFERQKMVMANWMINPLKLFSASTRKKKE